MDMVMQYIFFLKENLYIIKNWNNHMLITKKKKKFETNSWTKAEKTSYQSKYENSKSSINSYKIIAVIKDGAIVRGMKNGETIWITVKWSVFSVWVKNIKWNLILW